MADINITNLYVPTIENPYINELSTTKAALWRSGLVQGNADLSRQLNGGGSGNRFITPFNLSIEDDDAAVGSHDLDLKITPTRLAASDYQTCATTRAKSYNLSDISQIMSGANSKGVLSQQLGSMWTNNYQKDLISQTLGIIADNVANDSSDMVTSIWADTASPAAGNLMSLTAVINAKHQMGDARAKLSAIIMHSNVRKDLELLEPNNFVPASETNIGFDTYGGMIIIEDDGMTVNQDGTNDSGKYSTFIYGPDVFQYASYNGWSELEWDRDITSGLGTGEDVLVTRKRFILHPAGFDFVMTNNYDMPSRANYADVAKWDRKVTSRKQVPLAVIHSNASA